MHLPRRQWLRIGSAWVAFAAWGGFTRVPCARADAPVAASGERPPLALALSAPERLEPGDRAALVADLWLPNGELGPVLLTPIAEGPAVEVVRGRLLRHHADPVTDEGRQGLRFRIPIAAHTPGIAVVRVHAHALGCDGPCGELEATARLTLRVHRRPWAA